MILLRALVWSLLGLAVFSRLRKVPVQKAIRTEDQKGKAAEQQAIAQQGPVTVIDRPGPDGNGDRTYQEQQHRIDRWRLRIEIVALIVVAVGTGVALSTLRSIDRSTKAAEDVARIAAQQLEATDRPWLRIEVFPDGPFTVDKDGAMVRARYLIKNVGRSVAVYVVLRTKIKELMKGNGPYSEQREMCDAPLDIPEIDVALGVNVFPDETIEIRRATRLPRAEMEAMWKGFDLLKHPESNRPVNPVMFGCVRYGIRYGYQLAKRVHHTDFGFDVQQPDGRYLTGKPATPQVRFNRSSPGLQHAN